MPVTQTVWLMVGMLAVAFGIAGVVLPLVPTTPFLLLAAFCFARSSPRLHDWLVSHPRLGPPIADWRDSGAVSRPAKIAAGFAIAASLLLSIWLGAPGGILAMQTVVLAMVAAFLFTRPEPGADDGDA